MTRLKSTAMRFASLPPPTSSPATCCFKNFGVTRHGRVVFYDYDEICYMTEVNFRDIPQARYLEDELASEPWYSVSPGDVFRKSFATGCALTQELGRYLRRCTPTCSAPTTGGRYRRVSAKGTWKMFTPIGANSGFASDLRLDARWRCAYRAYT